ncbi:MULTISPECIES: aromatic-ring-hydroxylating dioxygenase subunit beta [Haloferacaceae]|uniref:Aromatic-ring-hydroxylating dioxygenase subunit beta n=1 Tax=Halorubrum glutamatedens TaxID=2707018 RepID=A0ABD5QRS4_9EURY|nr:aromatic-ring-hydroxylating dioxygenase subunit beta [Halobellus captivus]
MTNHELRLDCEEFLHHEAELLDDKRLHDWFELLTEDIEYLVPRRVTRERGSERSEFSGKGFLYRDDHGTLSTRVERFDNDYAWAENPPSRTRRFVSNVRASELSNNEADDVAVKSNLLLYRSQGDTADHDLIVGEREDRLRRVDGEFKLAKRTVYLDQTVLATRNLSFFL